MKKVLIVDDQDFIRTIFKQQLAQLEEITVIEAANGNEAMGKARVSKPDLILLDIVMPNKDGMQVLAELAEDAGTASIPVIVISSHAEDEKVAEAKKLGAREFIDKVQLNDIDLASLVKKYLKM